MATESKSQPDDLEQSLSTLAERRARQIANQFGTRTQVVAVALGGSWSAGRGDIGSDVDLYVYSADEISVEFRRALMGDDAEIDNRHFETGDEWRDAATGVHFDIMYRSPAWIEEQLRRVLVQCQASLGYTTCIWHNVLSAVPLFDPRGWYEQLKHQADVPYPEALRHAIIAKNWPIMRNNRSSYRRQIELALCRTDTLSVQHRVTALLASFFDIWFALHKSSHPGEKRLLSFLPEEWRQLVTRVVRSPPDTLLKCIDAMLNPLETLLVDNGLLI